jgi:hypothetical protein
VTFGGIIIFHLMRTQESCMMLQDDWILVIRDRSSIKLLIGMYNVHNEQNYFIEVDTIGK